MTRMIKTAIAKMIQPFFFIDRLVDTRSAINKRAAMKLNMPPRDIVKNKAADIISTKKNSKGRMSDVVPLRGGFALGRVSELSEGTRRKPSDNGMIIPRYAEKWSELMKPRGAGAPK